MPAACRSTRRWPRSAIDGKMLGDELARIGYAGAAPVPLSSAARLRRAAHRAGPGARCRRATDRRGRGPAGHLVAGDLRSPASPTTPAPRRCACATTPATAPRRSRPSCASSRGEWAARRSCTVGRIELVPNLINVIAARATLTADLRNTDEALLQEAEARLDAFLAALGRDEGVTIERSASPASSR